MKIDKTPPSVNKENDNFFDIPEVPRKTQKKQKLNLTEKDDFPLFDCFHNNVSLNFGEAKKVFPLIRYPNHEYGYYTKHHYSTDVRMDLLLKHAHETYAYKEKGVVKIDMPKIKEKIRVMTDKEFKPHQPFFLPGNKVNTYDPPYWEKIKTGMIARPPKTSDSIIPLIERVLIHLFPALLTRQRMLTWIKLSLQKRLGIGIVLEGESGIGKSAVIAMVSSLHYPNRKNSQNIHKFLHRFGWTGLDQTTFVGVNEGKLETEHLPDIKLFLTNNTFDAEAKNIRNAISGNYNSLMISSDRTDCFTTADEGVKRRIFMPSLTGTTWIDAGFTEAESNRIYNMDSRKDAIQADADTLEFYEYLEAFDETPYDLRLLHGFDSQERADEDFYSHLLPWQQQYFLHFVRPYCLKFKQYESNSYLITKEDIQVSRVDVLKSVMNIKLFFAEKQMNTIPDQQLRNLGKIDASIVKMVKNSSNEYRFLIKPSFVDGFLTNLWELENGGKKS